MTGADTTPETLGFCCPLCGAALTREGPAARCQNGHSFDVARQGYVHLLPANKMHAKLPGDSREMVAARRRFLQAGYYAIFRDALCKLALDCAASLGKPGGEGLRLCDAGCGEGYYTAALADALPQGEVYGFDISKLAVKAAAGQYKKPRFAVASSFAIPLPTGFADCLTDVFSPLAEGEFARVVKPGGYFLYAVPGPRHLYGMKELLYQQPYENPVRDTEYPGFRFVDRTPVRGVIRIPDGDTAQALFAMTPYYWKTGVTGARRLAETGAFETEIAFDFLRYQRV